MTMTRLRVGIACGLGVVALAACAHLAGRHGGPPDRIKIPHERHAAAKVECIACHEAIYDATDLAAPNLLPSEAKCLECHRARSASSGRARK